jgi:hypothetical protein
MAISYYWIGGSGSTADPSHWSFSSGGPPAYTTPNSGINAVFDSNGGSGTVSFEDSFECFDLTVSNNFSLLLAPVNTTNFVLRVFNEIDLRTCVILNTQAILNTPNGGVRLSGGGGAGSFHYIYLGGCSTSKLTVQKALTAEIFISSADYFSARATLPVEINGLLYILSGIVRLQGAPLYVVGDQTSSMSHDAVLADPSGGGQLLVNAARTVFFGGLTFATTNHTLNLSGQIEFRGYMGSATVTTQTLNPSLNVYLGSVYNYLGQDINGVSFGTGGTLRFIGSSIRFAQLTCKSETPSGSMLTGCGVELPSGYITNFDNGVAVPLVIEGQSAFNRVTLTNNVSTTTPAQIYATPGGVSNGTLQVYFCNLSYSTAILTGGIYLAYTAEGNLDGGNNTNWRFFEPANGFLGFFF